MEKDAIQKKWEKFRDMALKKNPELNAENEENAKKVFFAGCMSMFDIMAGSVDSIDDIAILHEELKAWAKLHVSEVVWKAMQQNTPAGVA